MGHLPSHTPRCGGQEGQSTPVPPTFVAEGKFWDIESASEQPRGSEHIHTAE